MSVILSIESSTSVCSIALSKGQELISLQETTEPNSHSRLLNSFIDNTIKENGLLYQDLDAVAISEGPGSYTGLRIGASAAKGLCYALDIPLISVSTLQAMALGIKSENIHKSNNSLFCPMIDARRMEVYTALYDVRLAEIESVYAKIIDNNSYAALLNDKQIVFGGDGCQKLKSVAKSENAVFLDSFRASAKYIAMVAFDLFKIKQFANTAYFEPFYLKEFVPGKSKVKGLFS